MQPTTTESQIARKFFIAVRFAMNKKIPLLNIDHPAFQV